MNTPTPSNSPQAPSLLSRAKNLLPSKLTTKVTTALIGMGLMANTTHDATAQTVTAPTSMTQSGSISEVAQVEKQVGEILTQPPENALRTEAIQILNQVRKQRSFNNTAQQERFFHILAALDQNVPLDKAVFVTETDGSRYLKLAPRKILKEFKIDSYDLSRFIV